MKPSKAKQAKIDILALLPTIGWSGPDRFGHYHAEAPAGRGTTKHVRIKVQSNSWRLEQQDEIPATTYAPASKQWNRIDGNFFKDTIPNMVQVPEFKAKLRPCSFKIEDSKVYVGFTRDEDWNGWTKAYVTASELETFKADFQDALDEEGWKALPYMSTIRNGTLTLLSGFCTELVSPEIP
jgi:hypothetical protein